MGLEGSSGKGGVGGKDDPCSPAKADEKRSLAPLDFDQPRDLGLLKAAWAEPTSADERKHLSQNQDSQQCAKEVSLAKRWPSQQECCKEAPLVCAHPMASPSFLEDPAETKKWAKETSRLPGLFLI